MKARSPNPNKTWYYKLLVTMAIPLLFIYYNILLPPMSYLKALMADQDGSLYRKTAKAKPPSAKKMFVTNAAIVLVIHAIYYMTRYWWLIAILFTIWLIYDIGLWPAMVSVAIWLVLWFLYRSFRQFKDGFN